MCVKIKARDIVLGQLSILLTIDRGSDKKWERFEKDV